jgi:D-amino-acid dehydrogenase
MLYKTKKEGDHEKEVARRAADEGLEVRELTRQELDELQPALNKDILGAVHYLCDAHTSPNEIMAQLKTYLKKAGVAIHSSEEVLQFEKAGGLVNKVITSKATYTPDEVVLASGSWSPQLGKELGIHLSVQAGKGYRINVPRPIGVTLPAILMEAKVAVTPMRDFTRFAGTMELSGINHKIRKERVQAIARAAENYYDQVKIEPAEIDQAQCGLRPVTPDGLPYIGRVSSLKNMTIATGHAMMGWSLGPATGKLVSEIIADRSLSMPIDGFLPERRF